MSYLYLWFDGAINWTAYGWVAPGDVAGIIRNYRSGWYYLYWSGGSGLTRYENGVSVPTPAWAAKG